MSLIAAAEQARKVRDGSDPAPWIVGIVGCGVMGTGIAELCLREHQQVVVVAPTVKSITAGRRRLTDSLNHRVRRGKLTEVDRDALLARVAFHTAVEALHDCEIAIEAAPEHEPTKVSVITELSEVLSSRAVLASTTSSIPIVRLARATRDPSRVIGLHFFNPVYALPLVEIISSILTAEDTYHSAVKFVTDVLGKKVVRAPDQAGFVVNALLIPYLLSAIAMVQDSVATAEDIDRGMTLGCAHPMGPLALADLIGLDVIKAVAESLYEEHRERRYAPPPLLSRMVDAGFLGKKEGRGFYRY